MVHAGALGVHQKARFVPGAKLECAHSGSSFLGVLGTLDGVRCAHATPNLLRCAVNPGKKRCAVKSARGTPIPLGYASEFWEPQRALFQSAKASLCSQKNTLLEKRFIVTRERSQGGIPPKQHSSC
ncbi:hypothetical protein NDU88_001699 [Pleurodeles waltl]|uniref:Uncharacterized protein n=1 Tax=Pleurodeles waltl TaxID=8319 RepID=A0AAV7NE60_PLEWA|nr:hypothetical protein NDU88_001699 [Pleurodeles waltl]